MELHRSSKVSTRGSWVHLTVSVSSINLGFRGRLIHLPTPAQWVSRLEYHALWLCTVSIWMRVQLLIHDGWWKVALRTLHHCFDVVHHQLSILTLQSNTSLYNDANKVYLCRIFPPSLTTERTSPGFDLLSNNVLTSRVAPPYTHNTLCIGLHDPWAPHFSHMENKFSLSSDPKKSNLILQVLLRWLKAIALIVIAASLPERGSTKLH